MHCFVFTPLDQASDADWEAFYEATGELPRQIEGLHRAWAGKLRQAKTQFVPTENGEFLSRRREYGVCMELEDEAALGYYADHAAHRAWEQVYERVREPATFTFDIVGP